MMHGRADRVHSPSGRPGPPTTSPQSAAVHRSVWVTPVSPGARGVQAEPQLGHHTSELSPAGLRRGVAGPGPPLPPGEPRARAPLLRAHAAPAAARQRPSEPAAMPPASAAGAACGREPRPPGRPPGGALPAGVRVRAARCSATCWMSVPRPLGAPMSPPGAPPAPLLLRRAALLPPPRVASSLDRTV